MRGEEPVGGPSLRLPPASLTADWLLEIADRLPDLVVITSVDGRAHYVNAAGLQMLGLTRDQVDNLRLHALHPTDELAHVVEEAIPAALRDGTWTGRTALLARGRSLPVLLTINAHRDGNGRLTALSLVGRDLSGYDAEVRERRQSEGLYRAITDHAVDMVTVIDEYGHTLYASPVVQRMLGYSPEEALALDNWGLIHPDDVLLARAALERLLAAPKEVVHADLRFRHKAGHWVPLEVIGIARLDDPEVQGILLYSRDVSHRGGLAQTLRARVDELEGLHEDRNLLLDKVAHDMNQPLSPILLQAHLLHHLYGDDPKASRAISVIEENARRLERFIRDFREVSQIERQMLEIHKTRIDLSTRVASVVKSLQAEAQLRKVRLDRVSYGSWPIDGDADRIDQVLFNLLTNAIKFTPAGGSIRVTARRAGRFAECIVQDSGRGLTPDEATRVFEPFVQVHDPKEVPEKGTGLGLSIARGIIEAHGGAIWAESDGRGKGARFIFRIPLAGLEPPTGDEDDGDLGAIRPAP